MNPEDRLDGALLALRYSGAAASKYAGPFLDWLDANRDGIIRLGFGAPQVKPPPTYFWLGADGAPS